MALILVSGLLFANDELANDWSVWQWFARINGNFQYNSNMQNQWWVRATEPIYISPNSYRNTLFFQGSVAIQDETKGTIGGGYRFLTPDENWIFGMNGFYLFHHGQKWSVGGDVQTKWVDLFGSYLNRAGHLFITAPIPYLPWLRVGAGYNSPNGYAFFGQANIYGFLSLAGGTERNNNFFRIQLNLGVPNYVQFTLYEDRISKTPFPARNLKKFVLTPVFK